MTKAAKKPRDPVGDARKKHKAHKGSGALWHDCVECNPLADEKTFLLAVKEPLDAAITVAYAASDERYHTNPDKRSHSLSMDHPWLRLREEVQRRLKNRKPLNDAQLAGNELLGRTVQIGVRSVNEGCDATSCVACGGTAETVIQLGALGRDAVRLCPDCMSLMDSALVTHFGNGKRSKAPSLLDKIADLVKRDSAGWADPSMAVEAINKLLWTTHEERRVTS